MKYTRLLFFGLVCFLMVSFSYDEPAYNPSNYEAVIMYRDDLEKSVQIGSPVIMTNSGKIYYKDQYIFVTKRYEGIHVIDNHDPANPVNKCFIAIPGCQDLSIKQNILYADNSVDLVAIDISDIPNNINVVKRVKKAFPNPLPPDLEYIPELFRAYNRPENTVIVGWKLKN